MSNKRLSKNLNNNVGVHCQTLVDNFFNFVDGNLDEVNIIFEIRDISDPMPPKLDQIRKMLARCDKTWREYCKFTGLPGESTKLFINRVKNKWQALEKQQLPQPITKHKRAKGQQ